MLETEDEIREIKKEIIESRGLIIKTNNLTSSLAADIKSIAKRQASDERRSFWNSAVAYILFAALSFIALKLLSDARINEIESEQASVVKNSEATKRQLADLSKKLERRSRAEQHALEFYGLIRSSKREEAIHRYETLKNEPLSPTEEKFFDAQVRKFRHELARTNYQEGLNLLGNGRYAEGAEALKTALKLDEHGPDALAIRFELARAMQKLNQTAEAVVLVQTVLEDEEGKALHDDALWLLSHCYESLGHLDDAVGSLRKLLRKFPRSEFAASARRRLGVLANRARSSTKKAP
ncbi:MAG: tetratricopeptide repeat protein [Myxococcales bacterium]|nr:MAG: tetratricopeptide repeat protein [Myxococcales bacterium]